MPSDLRIVVYTGVFDPVHFGHMDVVRRGSRLVDRLVVGVGDNPEKLTLFNQAERVELLQKVVGHLPNVEVTPFQGLAVQFVRSLGARVMLRGIRTTSDMEYEFTMSLTNAALDPEIDTIFLMAKETYSHISSSLLRQIAAFGGELDNFVPPLVRDCAAHTGKRAASQASGVVGEKGSKGEGERAGGWHVRVRFGGGRVGGVVLVSAAVDTYCSKMKNRYAAAAAWMNTC